MKYAIVFAASAALALAACSESETPAPEASASETAAATEAAAVPAGGVALAAGEAPTREYIVGTWGEAPGCKLPINFQADGTIKDGPFDSWTLTGNKLSMGGMVTLTLKVVDDKTMESTNDTGGGVTKLERCG